MAVTPEIIEEQIREAFPNGEFEIIDLVGDQNHYQLTIKDASFNDISLIAQHRLVKAALANLLAQELHAITIKTQKTI